jgi:hypothetical protein
VTEADWLAGTDLREMLEALNAGGLLSERKARLFAAACCRRVFPPMLDGRSRHAVTVCELYADGLTSQRALAPARAEAGAVARALEVAPVSLERNKALAVARAAHDAARPTGRRPALVNAVRQAADAALMAGMIGRLSSRMHIESVLPRCQFLRCILGNPFRPATVSPAGQTPQVVALAQAAYEQRELPAGTLDLARLAVLADALEEAGCDQADLLGHLRGPGPHVRGCWAVDLLLGKQ